LLHKISGGIHLLLFPMCIGSGGLHSNFFFGSGYCTIYLQFLAGMSGIDGCMDDAFCLNNHYHKRLGCKAPIN
jgi:hypothetical protein